MFNMQVLLEKAVEIQLGVISFIELSSYLFVSHLKYIYLVPSFPSSSQAGFDHRTATCASI
jgi:hypothetical protein